MKVRFLEDFEWIPPEKPYTMIVTARGGQTYDNIRREMGEAAIAAGKAEKLPAPRRRTK